MTLNESHEPSYYEVALTNRQVLVCFVILLSAVLGAFLSGVWVGVRNPGGGALAEDGEAPFSSEAPDQVASLEEFKFPDQPDAGGEPDLPDLGQVAAESRPETTLAQDVGSAAAKPPPRSTPPPPKAATPPPTVSPPPPAPPPPKPSPPPPKPSPPPPAAASGEGFIVQVFSGRDEGQAKKVLATVRRDGYTAFMAPTQRGGQTLHRVRLGPFNTRGAAEKAERDVKRKHKFETWVTAASN